MLWGPECRPLSTISQINFIVFQFRAVATVLSFKKIKLRDRFLASSSTCNPRMWSPMWSPLSKHVVYRAFHARDELSEFLGPLATHSNPLG